jgi:mono/diheme cytochrome c family protein
MRKMKPTKMVTSGLIQNKFVQMTKKIIKITAIIGCAAITLSSCSNEEPPLVYFPDMYFPVAYDPLMKAQDAYSKNENEIPAFVKNNGATGLGPVDGSVAQNPEGIVNQAANKPMTPQQYNDGYDASKLVTTSPLNPAYQAKDIERGKLLYNQTCAACHGANGNGQGPIVTSGAYAGVPNYADRELTIGSVHYVLAHGRNSMGSYAGQLKAGDQWRVSLYIMNAFKGGTSATAPSTGAVASADTAMQSTESSTSPKK